MCAAGYNRNAKAPDMQDCPYKTPDTCSQGASNTTANINAAAICNPNYPDRQPITGSAVLSAGSGPVVADLVSPGGAVAADVDAVSTGGVVADAAVSPVQLDNPSNEKVSAQGGRNRRISP
jgi:hypothetical protein